MSETFEEYFKNDDMPVDIDLWRCDGGRIPKTTMTKILKVGAGYAWNHQKKKIDAKDAEIERLKREGDSTCLGWNELAEKLESENKSLTSQLKLLTRCKIENKEGVSCLDCTYAIFCQGCRNKKLLETGE